ncbi:sulfite exporter TauE/SafE family protein [Candidatus Omnitrophota bacterium]
MTKNSWLLFLGFIAGLASASLGIGGGTVVVPSLVLLLGYDIKKAIGTSLATAIAVAALGVAAHYFIHAYNIRIFVALYIIAGSLIGAKLGSELASRISGRILKKILAFLLLFTGLMLAGIIPLPTQPVSEASFYPLLVVLGLFAGSASALLGIGGGILIVPVLHLFFGFPLHEAIPTSLAVILPTVAAGAVFHGKLKNIDMRATKLLIPTALLGAILGAVIENRLPEHHLKIIFGIFLLLCSIRLFTEKNEI